MLPLRLEIRNFLAYRQPDPVNFEGMHLACLTGPNGAGKSTLLDAITWVLWGQARTRSDDDLIYQGQTDMLVQLDFLQHETRYRVVRKRQKGKNARTGRSALELYVWDEALNQFETITAPSIADTQKKIIGLLRMDYDIFVNSAFLQQGRADAFTIKTPSRRKEILGEILGLDQWKDYEERAKAVLHEIDHELGVIAYRLEEIEQLEADEPALQRDLLAAEAALDDAAILRQEAEVRYNEVAGAHDQMSAAQNRLIQAQHRIRQRQADLQEIDNELMLYRADQVRLNELIAEREAIEAGYSQLQAARAADQQLGEKLQTMSTSKERLNEVNARIQAARAELEKQAGIHRDRIENSERSSAELDALRSDQADIQLEIARLEAEEARRDDLREMINQLNQESAELRTLNTTLFNEMQSIKTRIEDVQAAGAVCPLCGQPLDEAHKTALIEELQGDGTARGDAFRTNKARMATIADTIKAHSSDIESIEVDLRRLQALRDRSAALSVTIESAQSAADTARSERSALAAVEASLASGDYARELTVQRDEIQAEIDQLGYDGDAHNAARETLSTYHDYERRQHDLETALQQLPEVQTKIETNEARRERWLSVLEAEEKEAAEAQFEIDALQTLVEEARRRDEELRQRRTAEKQAQEKVIRAQQALTAIENARKRKADLQRRQEELAESKGIYEDLRAAFGKNGIPAMMIEAAIPELEEEANRLLYKMSDGRMYVRLDTQREKRTGGIAETLDILISDDLGTRSYECYSGGEAFRVNFALRVALSQMLARRAGAQLRTLFLDEGFGTQDDIGRQRLVEAINSVQDQFDLLLVITHIDDLRDAFPVQIAVSKTPDGSRVLVR